MVSRVYTDVADRLEIMNLVATGEVGHKISLESLAEQCPKVVYDPKKFAAARLHYDEQFILRAKSEIDEMRSLERSEIRKAKREAKKLGRPYIPHVESRKSYTVLLFATGVACVVGARSVADAERVCCHVATLLTQYYLVKGWMVNLVNFQVKNIVVHVRLMPLESHETGLDMDLVRMDREQHDVVYDSYKVPHAVLRLTWNNEKVIIMIHRDGRLIISGCKSMEDCEVVYAQHKNRLVRYIMHRDHCEPDPHRWGMLIPVIMTSSRQRKKHRERMEESRQDYDDSEMSLVDGFEMLKLEDDGTVSMSMEDDGGDE